MKQTKKQTEKTNEEKLIVTIEGINIKKLGENSLDFYSSLSIEDRDILINFINKAKKVGYARAKQDILKEIDKIERNHWDCNFPCGAVNSDTDTCKICGKQKETSWDNDKLEELKSALKENEKE